MARLAAGGARRRRLAAAGPAPLAEARRTALPEPARPALPEPAAGPERRRRTAIAAAGRAGSASAPPPLDPARLTASEIALLHQLAARRAALDQRARALDQREALIATAAAELERQIARLGELRAEIAAMVGRHDAAEEAKLTSLVKIYETMKPKAAAEIFDRLEMPVLIRVVGAHARGEVRRRARAHGPGQGQAGHDRAGAADRAARGRRAATRPPRGEPPASGG